MDPRNTEESRSRVRTAARSQLEGMLVDAGGTMELQDIYQRFKQANRELCDDSITCEHRDRLYGSPEWQHSVRWAILNLRDNGVVESAGYGSWRLKDSRSVASGAQPSQGARRRSPPSEDVEAVDEHKDASPELSLSALVEQENQELRDRIIDELLRLDPREFEHFGSIFATTVGFTEVQVTQYTNDDGVDVFGTLEMGVVKVRGAFQMKRWKDVVGRDPVVKFRGSIQGKYDHGIFVTTSSFSQPAKELASTAGAVPIVMIDGARLATIMIEHDLGVQTQPMVIRTINTSFFKDLRHV